jgi:chitodextrinase
MGTSRSGWVRCTSTSMALFLFVTLAVTFSPGTEMIASASASAPSLVVAQGLSGATVQLQWTAVSGATDYVVYRDDVPVTSQRGTLFRDLGLEPLATYRYRVSAVIDGVESAPSEVVSTTTQSPDDVSHPTRPGTISISALTASSATLAWGKSTDDVTVVAYRILRGTPGTPIDKLEQLPSAEGVTTYAVRNLRADTDYQFAVLAVDTGGNLSDPRTVTFRTLPSNDQEPPQAVASSSVSGSAFSSSRIDLRWGAVTAPDLSGYQIYRDGEMIAEVGLPLRRTYSDNGLAPSTTYNYQVRAIDSAGNVSALTTGRKIATTPTGVVQIKRGPYIQWAQGDAVRIAWWTNIPASSTVRYGTETLSEELNDPVQKTQHVMLIGGLTPGTTYKYQVVSGGASSTASSFRSAAPAGSAFSFAAVGDFGGPGAQVGTIASRIAEARTDFVQTVGDNVYPDSEDPDFTTTYSDFDARFYVPYSSAMRRQTMWMGGGNHEYYGDGAFWRNFWLPNNERWFSYDWGDAHFLVLDTELPFTPGTPQYDFAEADLAAHQDKAWRIAVTHAPPYSSTSNNSSARHVRTHLAPLLERYNVQLALTGHSHNYERSFPLRDGIPTEGGTTYVVSGGGGNGLNGFTIPQPEWSAFRQAAYQYLRITVTPSSMLLESRSQTDEVIDSYVFEGESTAGSIVGRVIDAETGVPISGATVESGSHSASTDQSGSYQLFGVAPGSNVVTAHAGGYDGQSATVVVSPQQETVQNFSLAPHPPPPVFSDGFESGTLSAWTSSAGLTVQSSTVNRGDFAAEGNTTNGATWAKKTLPSTYTDGYARIYFNLLSYSSQVNLLRLRTASDGSLGYLFVNTAGRLAFRNDVAAISTTSTTPVGPGWHSLELRIRVAGTSSTTDVWLDGGKVDRLSMTSNLGNDPIGKIQIGEVFATRTYNVVFDDVTFDIKQIGE